MIKYKGRGSIGGKEREVSIVCRPIGIVIAQLLHQLLLPSYFQSFSRFAFHLSSSLPRRRRSVGEAGRESRIANR